MPWSRLVKTDCSVKAEDLFFCANAVNFLAFSMQCLRIYKRKAELLPSQTSETTEVRCVLCHKQLKFCSLRQHYWTHDKFYGGSDIPFHIPQDNIPQDEDVDIENKSNRIDARTNRNKSYSIDQKSMLIVLIRAKCIH